MTDFNLSDDVRDATRAVWHRYLDSLTPFRSDLYRYCRRLTANLWDAEDLVQDTLMRGFATLGSVQGRIDNPRAYLMRVATNLWIDTVRRRESEAAKTSQQPTLTEALSGASPTHVTDVRDAGAVLLQSLAPQERAALVMKEVFDLSLEEIAGVLGTTIAAIKSALHRGRARLRAPAESPSPRQPPPSPALIDRFVERLNAADLPGLLELMLDTGSVEMLGSLVEVGREQFERKGSWLYHAVHVHPDLPAEMRPPKFLNERVIFEGEPLAVSFLRYDDQKLLMSVTRFEEQDGRIARIRAYNFCPETLQEVGAILGLPAGQVPYRFSTMAV